jgi:uncharacterized protein YggE
VMRLIFTCALSALMAGALVAPPAKAQQSQSERQANIIVIGEGSISAAPDYAQITAGVITRGKTAREATDANSKLMSAVTAALLDAAIAQKDIQTTRFSVQPVYTTQGSNTEQKLSGFSASNQVTVTIRQIDKVGDIVDRMVAAGVTNVGSLVFRHSDTSKLLDQARESAVADARRKADLYARASGVTLGRVVWITEDSTYAPRVPVMGLEAKAFATPIATGEDRLQVQITVGFEIAH